MFSPMKTSLEGNFLLPECPEGHCSEAIDWIKLFF